MENKLNIEINKFLVLGNNQDGCLLTGDKIDVVDFTLVENPFKNEENLEMIFKLKLGINTCALVDNNCVYLWGKITEITEVCENATDENNSIQIIKIKGLKFLKFEFINKVTDIRLGDSHILLLSDSKVYSFGIGKHGELGLGEHTHTALNFTYLNEIGDKIKITKIYAGIRTSFLIDGMINILIILIIYYLENKNIFCFGSNKSNELGLISENNKSDLNLLTNFPTPILNKNLKDINKIKIGLKFAIFISNDIQIFGSGDNSKGALGFDHKSMAFSNDYDSNNSYTVKNNICVLLRLDNLWNNDQFEGEIKNVKCGWNNTFILTTEGKVYSSGFAKFGQLGVCLDNYNVNQYHFVKIIFSSDEITFIEKLITGTDFFFAIDKDNNVYSWGWNEHFNLGHHHYKNIFTPQLINSNSLREIISKGKGNYKFLLGGAFVFSYKR